MSATALRLLALVALVTAGAAFAIDVPFLTGRIVDEAEILKPATRAKLTADLKSLEERTTHQVTVLTVPSLGGESVEDFAVRVFEAWKLGQSGKDNGVLVVVVPQDRRMRIEVGYGLEGTLTDAQAGRIIRDRMTPAFKAGDYDRGVAEGVAAIAAVLGGEKLAETGTSGTVSGFASAPWTHRIVMGFVLGLIGLLTVLSVLHPSWHYYFFVIPMWAVAPTGIVGEKWARVLLAIHIVAVPIAKLIVSRKPEYRKAVAESKRTGKFTYGGIVFTSNGASSISSGGGFSGGGGGGDGGGGSGGGGASGSW